MADALQQGRWLMTNAWSVGRAWACLGLCLAGNPHASLAQLNGVVVDGAGRGIAGAAIELWIDGSQDTTHTTTHGAFSLDYDPARGPSALLVIRAIGFRPARHTVRPVADTVRIVMTRIAQPLPEIMVLARAQCPNTQNGDARELWDRIRTQYASSSGWRALGDAYLGRVPASNLGHEPSSGRFRSERGCTEICMRGLLEKIKTRGYAWPWNGFKRMYDGWEYPPLESVFVPHFLGSHFAESHTFSAHERRDGVGGVKIVFCPRRTRLPGIEGSILIGSDSLIQEINWSFITPSPDESAGGRAEFVPIVEIGKQPSLLPIRGLFWRRSGRGYLQALMIYREWIVCESMPCGPGKE